MRIAKIVAGFELPIAGVAMLALPGPGWLTLATGLALLASEFAWARQLSDTLKGGRCGPRRTQSRRREHQWHRSHRID